MEFLSEEELCFNESFLCLGGRMKEESDECICFPNEKKCVYRYA